MKKRDLKKLALLGMTSGLLLSQNISANELKGFGESSVKYQSLLANSCAKGACSTASTSHGYSSSSCNAYSPSQSCNSNANPLSASCGASRSNDGNYPGNQQYQSGDISDNSTPNQNRPKGGQGGTNNNSKRGQGNNYYNSSSQLADASDDTSATTNKMSESELMSQLNSQGKATFQSLSPEGKKLALKLANGDCKAHNECKGLNSCKSDKNDCAGKGGCRGQGNGKFKDKNQAVKVAAMKMAEKRSGLQNNSMQPNSSMQKNSSGGY
jgi:hypothetical protein